MSASDHEGGEEDKAHTSRVAQSAQSAFSVPKPKRGSMSKPPPQSSTNPFDEDSLGAHAFGSDGSPSSSSGATRTKSLDVAAITERRRCAKEARLRTERAHQEHIEALHHAREQEELLHAAEEAFRMKQTRVWSDRYDELKGDYAKLREERDTLKMQLERNQQKMAEMQKETQQQEEWIKKLQENLFEVTKSLANDKKSTIGRIFGSSNNNNSSINRGPSQSQSPNQNGSPLGDSGRLTRNNSFIAALGRMTPAFGGGASSSAPSFDYTPSPKTQRE